MRRTFPQRLRESLPGPNLPLIQAACAGDPDQVLFYWDRWRTSVRDFEAIDVACARLLPRLFPVIRTCRPEDPDLPFIEETHRLTWFSNQRLLGGLSEFLDLAALEEIPVMLFKGAAVLTSCYPNEGSCFMADVDVAVPRENVDRLTRALRRAGWTRRPLETPGHSPIHQSEQFADPSGVPVEAHWDLLRWPALTVSEEGLWEKKKATLVRTRPCFLPANEDLLIQLLVRGFTCELIRQWRWMVDSALLIRKGHLDWDRFRAEAARRGVSTMCGEALELLATTTPLDLDAEIIDSLRKADSPPDRAIHAYLTGDYQLLHARGFFCLVRIKWRAALYEGKIRPGIPGFAEFIYSIVRTKLSRLFKAEHRRPRNT